MHRDHHAAVGEAFRHAPARSPCPHHSPAPLAGRRQPCCPLSRHRLRIALAQGSVCTQPPRRPVAVVAKGGQAATCGGSWLIGPVPNALFPTGEPLWPLDHFACHMSTDATSPFRARHTAVTVVGQLLRPPRARRVLPCLPGPWTRHTCTSSSCTQSARQCWPRISTANSNPMDDQGTGHVCRLVQRRTGNRNLLVTATPAQPTHREARACRALPPAPDRSASTTRSR